MNVEIQIYLLWVIVCFLAVIGAVLKVHLDTLDLELSQLRARVTETNKRSK